MKRYLDSLSLATKIISTVGITLLVVLGITTYLQYRQEERAMVSSLREEAQEIVGTLEMTLNNAMLKSDEESIQAMLSRVGGLQTVKRVYILNSEGKMARTSGDGGVTLHDVDQVRQSRNVEIDIRKTADGRPFVRALAPIRAEKACITCHEGVKEGDSLGFIGLDRWAENDIQGLRVSQMTTLGMHLACIFVTSLILVWVVRQISAPLKKMTTVAARIVLGDVNQKMEYHSSDEIGKLAQSFRDLIKYFWGLAEATERLSQGDMSVKVKLLSEQDALGKSFQTLIETMRHLTSDMGNLVESAKKGELNTRGEAHKYRGTFAELVRGMNETMDAYTAPIEEASAILRGVAEGDLSIRMSGDHKGEFKKIMDSLNIALGNLDQSLAHAAAASEQVASAAGQLGAGSVTLSQIASEGASSLEEISASLQELTSMTRQNAGSAKEAKSLSDGARSSADKGVVSMNRLSESIEKIKASSNATAKIVKTIDEIAFQTNLLALNAAVEAARAGEAGRGFAVVADEVRSLAMRSAEAAKNTAALIEESVKNAEGGYTINQEVIQNLDEINRGVTKVGEVIGEIAAASEQQTNGVEQISAAVEQMNQATQQVATNAEESSGATVELSGQAKELQKMIDRFKLSRVMQDRVQSKPAPTSKFTMPSGRSEAPALPAKVNGAIKTNPSQLIPFDDWDKSLRQEF